MPVAKKKRAAVRKTAKRTPKAPATHGPKFVSKAAAENVENAVALLEQKTTSFENGPSLEKGEDLCMTSRRFLNERKAALGQTNDADEDNDIDGEFAHD